MQNLQKHEFSTHAFTEGDVTGKGQRYFVNILNSRLHGRRLQPTEKIKFSFLSQLTPSRKATKVVTDTPLKFDFSTHAFTEGDCKFK